MDKILPCRVLERFANFYEGHGPVLDDGWAVALRIAGTDSALKTYIR